MSRNWSHVAQAFGWRWLHMLSDKDYSRVIPALAVLLEDSQVDSRVLAGAAPRPANSTAMDPILRGALRRIEYRQHLILGGLRQLLSSEETMTVDINQIDAALAAESGDITTLNETVGTLATTVTQVDTDIATLITKVNNGTVPPQDFATELAAIQKNHADAVKAATTLQLSLSALQSEDVAAQTALNPTPTTPVATGS